MRIVPKKHNKVNVSKNKEDVGGAQEAASGGDGELSACRCGCIAAGDSSVEENLDISKRQLQFLRR